MVLLFCRNVFSCADGYWWLFASYFVAKIFEYFDVVFFEWTNGIMADQAIKHLIAALGLWALLRYFITRRRMVDER